MSADLDDQLYLGPLVTMETILIIKDRQRSQKRKILKRWGDKDRNKLENM